MILYHICRTENPKTTARTIEDAIKLGALCLKADDMPKRTLITGYYNEDKLRQAQMQINAHDFSQNAA